MKSNNFNDKIEIDISNYKAGIYILKLQNDKEILTYKIIKQ